TQYNQTVSSGAVTLDNNVTLDLTVTYLPSFTLGNLAASDKIYLLLGGYTSGVFGNVTPGVFDANYNRSFDEIYGSNGSLWAIFYGADSLNGTPSGGSDIALFAIPEPETGVMLLGGFGMLALVRRLRVRRQRADAAE